ncbi:MAG TPA: hypothetical protein VGK74_02550 [Symbiobacteriaceae bacterium]
MKPVARKDVWDALLRLGVTGEYASVSLQENNSLLLCLYECNPELLSAISTAFTAAGIVHSVERSGLRRIICTGVKDEVSDAQASPAPAPVYNPVGFVLDSVFGKRVTGRP